MGAYGAAFGSRPTGKEKKKGLLRVFNKSVFEEKRGEEDRKPGDRRHRAEVM